MKRFVRDYKSERIIKSISDEKKTALIEAEKEYKKSLNEISSIHMKKCKRILIISIILWIAFLLGVLILLLNYNILCAFIWFILLSIYCDAYIYKRADNLVGGIHENFVELIFKIPIAKTEKIVKALEEKYRENIKEINKKYKNIVESAIKEELEANEPSVIISRKPCALLKSVKMGAPYSIDPDKCIGCKMCMQIGCPAISLKDGKPVIDPAQCAGCGLCEQFCRMSAVKGGESK